MYLDILIVMILLLTILKGYLNGFFLETLSFFGVIINIVFSRILTPIILLKFAINPDSPLYSWTYALIFLGVYMLMGIFIAFIKRSLRNAFRGKLNSVTGSILGFFKGFIIYFVILFFYSL
jgi:membrane protein required for colicin V production